MLIESIILAIFVLSFGGALYILAKKIPVLSTLPQNGSTGIKKYQIISDAEDKVKEILAYFENQILLHKFLSWSKCKVIKMESWIDHILTGIRKKAKEEKLNKKK